MLAGNRPGDRQAIPGTIQVLKDGKNKYQVGNNENIFDFTYVDNVVHAHLLAAERLHLVIPYETFAEQIGPLPTMPQRRELPTSLHRPSNKWLPNEDQNLVTSTTADIKDFDVPLPARRNRFDQFIGMNPSGEADSKFVTNQIRGTAEGVPVAGQAFYVTNGEPIPFWDFIRAVWFEYDGTSVTQPWVVPPGVALVVATFAEAFATLLRRPTPNMSASRIVHTTTTRYFNIEKARRLLDYEPVVGLQEGIQRAVAVRPSPLLSCPARYDV